MKQLVWDGQRGFAQNGAISMTLIAPPALGFAFETLDYSDAATATSQALASVNAGTDTEAPDDQVVAINTYLDLLDDANASSLVWGVDVNGYLLGLVPLSQAFMATPPQPSPASAYRYNFDTKRWMDQRPLLKTVVELAMSVTLGAGGTQTATFSAPFDAQPIVLLTALNPSGRAVLCEVQSFVMDADQCTGCVVKGYRSQPLPADSSGLSNFDPFGGDASGLVVFLHVIKAPS